MYCRGVSGFLKVGGQVVIQVVMRRRSLLFCQKVGGQLPPPSLTPLFYEQIDIILLNINTKCLRFQVKSDSETNTLALEALLKQEKDKNREATIQNSKVSK